MKLAYSGILFPEDYDPLIKEVESCFQHKLGPGDLPTKRKEDRIYGILVPHSLYKFSGPCSAWAYKTIAENYFPETFVILFPDTSGKFINYATILEDIETVFGTCYVDKQIGRVLVEQGIVTLANNFREYSFELQLPFLQHMCKDKIHDVKILPIIIPHSFNAGKLAEEIIKIKKDLVVIMVSELTAFGANFLYQPFKYNIDESVNGQDMALIKFILDFDSEGFFKYVKKNKIPMPGKDAVVVGIELLKQLGVKKGELLSYYRSNEIDDDKENFVSYSSLVFTV